MLFKACSFAALSCVKVLPPVGAKWVFPPALAGHQVEFLPPVQPEAPLTLLSERLLSLTLLLRLGLPPVSGKWGFSTGTGGAPSGVPSTGAAGTSLDATI